jgi:hypothetical protein
VGWGIDDNKMICPDTSRLTCLVTKALNMLSSDPARGFMVIFITPADFLGHFTHILMNWLNHSLIELKEIIMRMMTVVEITYINIGILISLNGSVGNMNAVRLKHVTFTICYF